MRTFGSADLDLASSTLMGSVLCQPARCEIHTSCRALATDHSETDQNRGCAKHADEANPVPSVRAAHPLFCCRPSPDALASRAADLLTDAFAVAIASCWRPHAVRKLKLAMSRQLSGVHLSYRHIAATAVQ